MTERLWKIINIQQKYGTLRIIGATKNKADALARCSWEELPKWARRRMTRVQGLKRAPRETT